MQDSRGSSTIEEDEIDLRPYVMAVARHWKAVAGVTVLFTAVAAAVSFATPVTYEATTSVAVARFGAKPTPEIREWIDLAKSDRVLMEVAQELASQRGSGGPSVEYLEGSLRASGGADPSIVSLTVSDPSAESAKHIADTWATVFLRTATGVFGASGIDPSTEFDDRLKDAREELSHANDDLIAVRSRDRTDILRSELRAQLNALTALYASRVPLRAAAQETRSIQARMQSLNPTTPASPSDEMAIMLIQANALTAPPETLPQTGERQAGSTIPLVQFQLSVAAAPSSRTVAAQLVSLRNLAATIDDRISDVNGEIAAMQPKILELQAELQEAEAERLAKESRRDSTIETVKQLSAGKNSYVVSSISANAGSGTGRLVGDTAIPRGPAPKATARNAAAAAILGLTAGLAWVFGTAHLRAGRSASGRRSLGVSAGGRNS